MQCKNCFYSKKNNTGRLECFYNPPSAQPLYNMINGKLTAKMLTIRPLVQETDFCSNYDNEGN